MPEGTQGGSWEEQKHHLDKNSDFHLDSKVDVVETLINQVGWEGAMEQINENLDANPDDPEARRQANLIVTLSEARLKELKDKLNH